MLWIQFLIEIWKRKEKKNCKTLQKNMKKNESKKRSVLLSFLGNFSLCLCWVDLEWEITTFQKYFEKKTKKNRIQNTNFDKKTNWMINSKIEFGMKNIFKKKISLSLKPIISQNYSSLRCVDPKNTKKMGLSTTCYRILKSTQKCPDSIIT